MKIKKRKAIKMQILQLKTVRYFFKSMIIIATPVKIWARFKAQYNDDFISGDDGSSGVEAMFNNVYSDYAQIAEMIGGMAYIAGLCFFVAAMLKMKQHRDNPQQASSTAWVVYLLAGVGLIFLPSALQEGATTLFTSIDSSYGGVSQSNISNNPWS
jgi:intracellular multiplication protein IcmD